MDIIKEEVIAIATAKRLLEEREKTKELGYEQKAALEHLKKFSKLTEAQAQQLWDELKGIEKLRDAQIAKIINIMPKNADELKVLFMKERTDLGEEDAKKILEATGRHI